MLACALRCENLYRTSWLTLKGRLLRLRPAESAELAEASDRATARWFSGLYVVGMVLVFWFQLYVVLPAAGGFVFWMYKNIASMEPGQPQFWESAALLVIIVAQLVAPLPLAIRERRLRRKGSGREDVPAPSGLVGGDRGRGVDGRRGGGRARAPAAARVGVRHRPRLARRPVPARSGHPSAAQPAPVHRRARARDVQLAATDLRAALRDPARAGTYDSPLPPGEFVHAEEHGHVVIVYAPGTPRATVAGLEQVAKSYPGDVVLTPYGGIPHGIALAAWGRLETLDRTDRARIDAFVVALRGRYDHKWIRSGECTGGRSG